MSDDVSAIQRRLPELQFLPPKHAEEVEALIIEEVPDYVWLARAAKNHHPPDERGMGGLWLHLKRTMVCYLALEPTFRAMSRIDQMEAMCGRTAMVLHDMLKYGHVPDNEAEDHHPYAGGRLSHLEPFNDQHDVEMAELVRTSTDLPDEVAQAVESHGGSRRWNGSHAGPAPKTDLQMLVHMADMFASTEHFRLPVHEPTVELQGLVEYEIPVIVDEEWIESKKAWDNE